MSKDGYSHKLKIGANLQIWSCVELWMGENWEQLFTGHLGSVGTGIKHVIGYEFLFWNIENCSATPLGEH